MVKVERFPLNPEAIDSEYHKTRGVHEAIAIKVDSEGAHFGAHMKVVLTIEEATNVRDQLNLILTRKRS